MDICIDFDGTIVKHDYPEIGEPVPLAIETIKSFKKLGHRVILFTMRSDKYLDDAVSYLLENGIELDGVNVNPDQKEWTSSPKAYGNIYIDDNAFGCPLITEGLGRPFVNWRIISERLISPQPERN